MLGNDQAKTERLKQNVTVYTNMKTKDRYNAIWKGIRKNE